MRLTWSRLQKTNKMTYHRILRAFPIAAIVAVAAFLLHAQDTPQDPNQDQVPTFKSGVDVVTIQFIVKDKHGGLIPNLKKEDFQVAEEGTPQKIKYFSAETNLPLTMGMLIDTSGSMRRVLPAEQELGGQFVRQVMTPKDVAFLINFDVNVELAQDVTSDPRDVARELNKTKINAGGGFGGGGIPGIGQGPVPIKRSRGTALYDAVYLASHDKLANEVGRKALIVLTDGMDTGSKSNLRDAIEAAQRSDAIVYVILVYDRAFGSASGDMEKLSSETGGRVIEVGSDFNKMKEAFDRISAELRSQYSLGYTSTNPAKDGKFRKVEIKTAQGKVQARKGYYAFE
jgi:VWFA-related protein